MFAEGGRHSGEVTSSVSIFWLIHHLVSKYGKDTEVTHLVDTKTLYLRPVNNPDEFELFLRTAQSNRSSVRPHDTDRDGLLDEDPGEDLDGDGVLFQMRWQVGEGKGNAILDPREPSGRLMKTVPDGEGNWQVVEVEVSTTTGMGNTTKMGSGDWTCTTTTLRTGDPNQVVSSPAADGLRSVRESILSPNRKHVPSSSSC